MRYSSQHFCKMSRITIEVEGSGCCSNNDPGKYLANSPENIDVKARQYEANITQGLMASICLFSGEISSDKLITVGSHMAMTLH